MPKSPAKMVSGISTNVLPENPNELRDGLNFLRQEKPAGTTFNINNEEITAIADKPIEWKYIYTKQRKVLLPQCFNPNEIMK